MATHRIPYESLDPLTIGASGDEDKVNRDELELEIADGNLLAAIYPDEPEPIGDATDAARARARGAGGRAALLRAARGQEPPRDRHRQPVPADAAVEAPARRARRGRGRRHRGGRRLRERQGLPDVGVRHRAEDRPREPRPHGEARHRVLPERAAERRDVHLRRRLLARHAGLAALRGRRGATSRSRSARPSRTTGARAAAASSSSPASSPTRRSSRTTARSFPRRRRTTAPTPGRCAPTSTRSRRCAGSTAR